MRLRVKQIDGQWAVVNREDGRDWVMEFFASEGEAMEAMEAERTANRHTLNMRVEAPVSLDGDDWSDRED